MFQSQIKDRMANSEDPDENARYEPPHLDQALVLVCLFSPIFDKTIDAHKTQALQCIMMEKSVMHGEHSHINLYGL